eukprot:TRINITY_DN1587_c3_g1_i7.p12 TRINITY_DN1587_c3_g1~~TRINITY_DN1587_c3_g1_i7.p12  ORF type:complete len:107 (-),score=0.50 TRINITY_DN1587_c3_g1_i7:645-965(-)
MYYRMQTYSIHLFLKKLFFKSKNFLNLVGFKAHFQTNQNNSCVCAIIILVYCAPLEKKPTYTYRTNYERIVQFLLRTTNFYAIVFLVCEPASEQRILQIVAVFGLI